MKCHHHISVKMGQIRIWPCGIHYLMYEHLNIQHLSRFNQSKINQYNWLNKIIKGLLGGTAIKTHHI